MSVFQFPTMSSMDGLLDVVTQRQFSNQLPEVQAISYAWGVSALQRLDELSDLRDVAAKEWHAIRPSDEARRTSQRLIAVLAQQGFHALPKPLIFPTRSGGLQLEWRKGGRELQLEIDGAGEIEFLRSEGGVADVEGSLDLSRDESAAALARWLICS